MTGWLKPNTLFVLFVSFCFLFHPALFGGDEESINRKQKIFLLPVRNITENKDYVHLESFIYNVLTINIDKQESLRLYTDSNHVFTPVDPGINMERLFSIIFRDYSTENCLICEYYVVNDELHILINLWDTVSFRIKNTYRKTMPTDLDMLSNIENMSNQVAENIGRVLPMLEREALLQRRVNTRLYNKLDSEERLLDEVFSRHNEIQLSLFTGLHCGRTAVSFSSTGFFISPSLCCEYSLFFKETYHMRFGLEYLPFDIMDARDQQTELCIEVLFGFHTLSLYSFSIDTGLAFIYDYNSASSALSYHTGDNENVIKPSIERFSISLPFRVGMSLYLTSGFFLNFRLTYHGLTYTFEPLSPSEYNEGSRLWKYHHGFSPWTLLCIAFTTQLGFRF
jgi:hypothetical protein